MALGCPRPLGSPMGREGLQPHPEQPGLLPCPGPALPDRACLDTPEVPSPHWCPHTTDSPRCPGCPHTASAPPAPARGEGLPSPAAGAPPAHCPGPRQPPRPPPPCPGCAGPAHRCPGAPRRGADSREHEEEGAGADQQRSGRGHRDVLGGFEARPGAAGHPGRRAAASLPGAGRAGPAGVGPGSGGRAGRGAGPAAAAAAAEEIPPHWRRRRRRADVSAPLKVDRAPGAAARRDGAGRIDGSRGPPTGSRDPRRGRGLAASGTPTRRAPAALGGRAPTHPCGPAGRWSPRRRPGLPGSGPRRRAGGLGGVCGRSPLPNDPSGLEPPGIHEGARV